MPCVLDTYPVMDYTEPLDEKRHLLGEDRVDGIQRKRVFPCKWCNLIGQYWWIQRI